MDTLKEIGIQRWRLRDTQHSKVEIEELRELELAELDSESNSEVDIQANVDSPNIDQPIVDQPIVDQSIVDQSNNADPQADANLDASSQHIDTQSERNTEQEGTVDESLNADSQPQFSWQMLGELLESDSGCTSCANTNPVLGDGNINAQWMFVIDAPSARDMQDQKLLSGRQGQLFDAVLHAVGQTREEIYLSSVFKCPPSSDITLTAQCGELIHHQIQLVKPRLILAMGEFSAQSLLRANEDLEHLRDQDNTYPGGSSAVVCTFSLAQLLNAPSLKAQLWQDLKKCIAALH